MKKLLLSISALILIHSLSAQNNFRQITVEDIWSSQKFAIKSIVGMTHLKDGEHYAAIQNKPGEHSVIIYEYKTGKTTETIFTSSTLTFNTFELSADETKILLSTEEESIYRHSRMANWFVYDIKTKKTAPLSENGKQQTPMFSPDGSKIAFARENNLFVKDLLTNREIPVTTDGRKNEIINGSSDWVYEEEFVLLHGFEWSPDGKRIAYYRFDESKVKEFSMDIYGEVYPQKKTFKYPVAGETNSIVTINIYDVSKTSSVKVPVFKDGSVTDQYIPRIKWTNDPNSLSVLRLNRAQNLIELLLVNANTGQNKTILEEDSRTYIDADLNVNFLEDKKHFIWRSGRDGFAHLYLYNLLTGVMEKQITSGKWEVTSLIGVDGNAVYYQSTEISPIERTIYSIHSDGTGKKQLSTRKGTNGAEFSRNFKYFINTNTSANTPAFISLNNSSDGKEIKVLEDNSTLNKTLSEYALAKKEFFKFKIKDGTELNGYMMKPAGFSESKKYPVLMYCYGGPGSSLVTDAWDVKCYLWFQLLCEKGYIVCCVDNRGTGGRGEEFKKCTFKNLGKIETEDQIAAAGYLGSLSYVDKGRIGIWGWSYGGYLSALSMAEGGTIFKTGIAVAPVSNWKNYDAVYVEKFMQTPKQNPEGYSESSVIPHLYKMSGKFLLIHGTADDNVHLQNSMEIMNELISKGKQFDMFMYPNKAHSLIGENTRTHLYTKMTDFLLENL